MTNQPLLIVVLAAGKGVRMRSSVPKVLHTIAGRSMLAHALATARAAGADKLVLVVAPGMEAVRVEAAKVAPDIEVFEQATLRRLVTALDAGAQIAALGFEAPDASGYGRLLLDAKGRVKAICEHNDASEEERRIGLCNAGAMAFRVPKLAELLSRIANSNVKREYYLTDVVAIAAAEGSITLPASCAPEEA